MCRRDSQNYFCKESGILPELLNSEWAGFLYICKTPVDFCLYCISRFQAQNRSVPFCFYMRESDCVTATGLYKTEAEVNFYIPKHENPVIVYRDSDTTCNVLIVDFPEQLKKYIRK